MDIEEELPRYGAMTKGELAELYMPLASSAGARRMLNLWISKNSALSAELAATGYNIRTVTLTPLQVMLIIRYLGEP
ncbi:DUF4248 domain-containing protein [uncultured Bacteroides sp.]|uniref:DUF4248 domain-containing protein n=1 Tax=uncultured Bacteroides sp. TaxID=162156 RepID=UPI002AABA0C6|nr:DUF4248 domain-containing protein [uncultured Bacteroides sp.]